jgi:transcriptional regulator with XRE-family HTH domain
MTVEDLITKAPYEQQGAYGVGNRRRHLIGIRAQTASPLNEFVDNANRMIDADDATEPRRPSRLGVTKIFIAATDDSQPQDAQDVEQSTDPGAPTATVLLKATTELSTWLKLSQKQVATLVGISPSTVMAWRRAPMTHPRHASIPHLLRLWAAASGAREELGDTATLQLVWGSREHPGRGAITLGADDLAERLLAAAEAASLEAFEDTSDYDPGRATRPSTGQLAADEEALSRSLNEDLTDSGESTAE